MPKFWEEVRLWEIYDGQLANNKLKYKWVKDGEYKVEKVECLTCKNEAYEFWGTYDVLLADGRKWNTEFDKVGFYCPVCKKKWGFIWKF